MFDNFPGKGTLDRMKGKAPSESNISILSVVFQAILDICFTSWEKGSVR